MRNDSSKRHSQLLSLIFILSCLFKASVIRNDINSKKKSSSIWDLNPRPLVIQRVDVISSFSILCNTHIGSSHAPLRNLKFYLLPDSSTSNVFRTRAIVSVVYSIVFSANPVKPYARCVAPPHWRLLNAWFYI